MVTTADVPLPEVDTEVGIDPGLTVLTQPVPALVAGCGWAALRRPFLHANGAAGG